MIKNMKISTRLIIGFTVIAIIGLITGFIGLHGLNISGKSIDEIGRVRLPGVQTSMQMARSLESNAWRLRFLLNPTVNLKTRIQIREDFARDRQLYKDARAIYEPLSQTQEEAVEWKAFSEDVPQWLGINNQILELHRRLEALGILNPDALLSQIRKFKIDHYVTQIKVIDLIQEGTFFEGGTDHSACNFGKWLATFDTENPEILKILKNIREPHRQFHEATKQILELMKQGKTADATHIFHNSMQNSVDIIFNQFNLLIAEAEKSRELYQQISSMSLEKSYVIQEKVLGHLNKVLAINNRIASAEVSSAHSQAQNLRKLNLMVMVAGFALAVFLGWLLSRAISAPVIRIVARAGELMKINSGLVRRATAIADGDLSMDEESNSFSDIHHNENSDNYEIDQLTRVFNDMDSQNEQLTSSFREMCENLNEVMIRVREAVEEVGEGSRQIADASQSLSNGATESAASVEEISASSNEVGQQATLNADNAEQANRLARNAMEAAELGGKRMSEMVSAMTGINDSSKQISRIIKVIDEIAFQTNLLALNAAVEAARAGKYGKGFAVVAEEVRNLAGRSARAAQETSELIESSGSRVEAGTMIANQTAEALGKIVDGITRAADIVGEIAASSNEQALGMAQISEGLGQIDSVTQQNTANAEETAASAEELSRQSQTLEELIARFKLKNGQNHKSGRASRNHSSSEQSQKSHQLKSGSSSRNDFTGSGASELSQNSRKTPRSSQIQERPQDIINLDDDDFGKF
ncbi:MAG: hypothetical protein CVV64_19355 [Candidatus Wallbacteria bacterium HGW-Wallbacteria-1]|jgi:methyl-accepting chemotaxis protein|uniref:Methyl-accepting transducer domain-containing protein n=1 Tax=Candidatus Wallbacteria bacterium HGW-Wallbacteria-1 TaxID=2013854 RepID=A0A2N1PJ18_9BACT|nr:MAG: hypothetical protein CVV64_19355 [Candidatus Wallbacteria bacterium HGW-Wallbacteria-1]